jgi:hypothetical protein
MPEYQSDQSEILIRLYFDSINDHLTRRIPLRPSDQSNRPHRHRPREHPYHWQVDSCIPLVSVVASRFQARRCLHENVNHWQCHVQSPKDDIPKLRMQIPSSASPLAVIDDYPRPTRSYLKLRPGSSLELRRLESWLSALIAFLMTAHSQMLRH